MIVEFDFTVQESFFSAESGKRYDSSGRFAKIAANRNLSHELSLQPKHRISPIRYNPGNQFKHALSGDGASLGHGDRVPYRLPLELRPSGPIVEGRVSPRVDQFGPCLFLASVSYRISAELGSLNDLVDMHSHLQRQIADSGDARQLRSIAAVAAGRRPAALEPGAKRRVHTEVAVSHATIAEEEAAGFAAFETDFARHLAQTRRAIIAQHITLDPKQLPDPRLESALMAENKALNLKSESHLLLVNAGGSTLYTTKSRSKTTSPLGSMYKNRHSRVIGLAEIATVIQHLLLRASSPEEIDALSWSSNKDIIERWVRFPSNTLFTSVSNQMVWRALSKAFALETLLDEYEQFDTTQKKTGWN